MRKNLNESLLHEIFSLSLRNKKMTEVVSAHLKKEYMPNEEYMEILSAIQKHWKIYQKPMSFGLLLQKFEDNDDILDLIDDIQDANTNSSVDELVDELQAFIKKAMFVQGYETIGEEYNNGRKSKAIEKLIKLADEYSNFNMKGQTFDLVIDGFESSILDTKVKKGLFEEEEPVTFGIDCLDELTGGIKSSKGQVICFMAPSGGGKTKVLRWVGAQNLMRGLNVLHVQLEGTQLDTITGYQATLMGVNSSTIETGNLDSEVFGKWCNNIKRIKGEILIKTHEKFSEIATTLEVRQMILDAEKSHNLKIDVLIVDYLELLDTADTAHGKVWSSKDERHRRTKIADELMDISKEFKITVFTATQANDVPPTDLNNKDFVLTRHNVSEAKSIVKPLTMFITINRTREEAQEDILRLFVDKSRYTKAGDIFEICTNYGVDRFYDKKKTMAMAA